MDPRLRAAVDASLAWYDDVFALHGIPTKAEAGLWWALGPPPPWHSGVKTNQPGVSADRVLAVHEQGAVADSFGDLDLGDHGFRLLIEAAWVHHSAVPDPPSALPRGWTVVRDPGLLAQWSRAHDYEGVLLPRVLELPAFSVLAWHSGDTLVGGAVVHRPPGRPDGAGPVVGLSNAWSVEPSGIDHAELLAAVGVLHPGAAVTDYAAGDELTAMTEAGYASLGPQLVWLPPDA